MIDRLESHGSWKINLDVSQLFTDKWGKALELRSNYLHDARQILLQDLFGQTPKSHSSDV
jgi:membrane protein